MENETILFCVICTLNLQCHLSAACIKKKMEKVAFFALL